jgi:hypothetical protein
MMRKLRILSLASIPRRLISPGAFLLGAVVFCLLFALCQSFGWREDTAFLSGHNMSDEQVSSGILYMLAYFGFVVVAPILLLTAVFFRLLLRLK